MEFYKLTAKDAAAFRQGNRVAVYYGKDGRASCRVIQNAPRDVPFAREAEHEMNVPVTVDGYNPKGSGGGRLLREAYADVTAFGHIYLYDWHKGPFALLKAGDEIAFHFLHDNNNETVNKAGLHFDTLSLIIHRKGGDITLTVETSICLDNSARMVRGLRYHVGEF